MFDEGASMADNRETEPDDPELDAMIRNLRRGRVVSALTVSAMVACSLGVLAILLYLTFMAGRRSATRAPEPVPHEEIEEFRIFTALPLEVRMNRAIFVPSDQTVTVRSAVPDSDDGWYYGTGFLISDALVISAAHVVPHASGSETYPVLIGCYGREVEGGVIAYDELRDVMAVFAPGCRADDLEFSTRRLTTDDVLHASGFMFHPGKALAARYFRYTSYIPDAFIRGDDAFAEPELRERVREMRRQRVPRYRAITGAAIPGNSGSPVFDDQGRIVGMLVVRDSLRGRSYMVPARTLVRFLRVNALP